MAVTTPDTQRMVAYQASDNGAVRRFRNPSKFDVLSGRGGSVNAHAGNVFFREIVQVRKVEYNLESNKERKNQICREVIAQVTDKGGTFLVKENNASSGGGLWTELSDERTMAKVSQALREGAPRMRQAIRGNHTGSSTVQEGARKRASSRRHVTDEPSSKRVRVEYRGQQVHPNQISPEMTSTPWENRALPTMALPNANPIPNPRQLQRSASSISLTGIHDGNDLLSEQFINPFQLPEMPAIKSVQRAHSLVLSDISAHPNYLQDDFVNPFDDEEVRGALRRQSSNTSDMGGLSALFHNDADGMDAWQHHQDSFSSTSSARSTPII